MIIIGFAAVTVVWGSMGLVYPLELSHAWPPFGGESYSSFGLYAWSSYALFAFILWATTLFALPLSIPTQRRRDVPVA